MKFSHILQEANIDPATTLCMRHKPIEKELRRAFKWLAVGQPEVFNAYQSTQKPREEKQLLRAEYLAAFIGDRPGRAVFVGLYKNEGSHQTTFADRQKIKAWRDLVGYGFPNHRDKKLWFDLKLMNQLYNWSGKLMTEWTGERSWSRWASKLPLEVLAITEESLFAEEMPNWRRLILCLDDLNIIPEKWIHKLSEWRGIYYVFDVSNKQGYVGSAYGAENLFGRWKNYAKSGHGGNKLLRKRDPKNLRFSILERLSPDTPADETIQRENTWKERLHTREFGLNDN